MILAALICLVLSFWSWIKTWHCNKRSLVRDGNTEGFGLLFYLPFSATMTGLTLLFGLLWLCGF